MISSQTRSQCTCFRAFGMLTTGQQEVGWRRQIGRMRHSCPLTRTSTSRLANGRILTLHAYQPPLKIGGINTMLGISRLPRKWTMLGCRETLLFMTIVRILIGTQNCPRSVLWVHGNDEHLAILSFFSFSILNLDWNKMCIFYFVYCIRMLDSYLIQLIIYYKLEHLL